MLSAIIGLPRWVKGLALIVAGIAAFMLWLHFHDRGVVKKHDAEQRAKVTERELEAERGAERNDDVRRVERERKTDDLDTARERATREQPDEASKPAGPAVRAVLDELRRQHAGHIDPAA